MPNIDLRITKAARVLWLRARKESIAVLVRRIIANAIQAKGASLDVVAHLALERFATDIMPVTLDDAEAMALANAAATANLDLGEFASRLLHALHMCAEPEGAAKVTVQIDSPPGSVTRTAEWPTRMGPRGLMIALGDKEFLVRGELYCPTRAAPLIRRLPPLQTRFALSDDAEAVARTLRKKADEYANAYLGEEESLVSVKRVGRGPTAKSAKFRFEAVHTTKLYGGEGRNERKTHDYLFPVSLLREIDGQQFVPAWVAREKLRAFGHETSVEPVGLYRGASGALYEQLAPLVAEWLAEARVAHERWLTDAPSRAAAAEQERMRREGQRMRDAEAAAEAKIKAAEREARLAIKKAARVPDLELQNARVEWPEWVGPSSSQQRVDHVDESCTVRFFGTKREITLPNGRQITKMQGAHLRIFDSGGTLVVSADKAA